MSLTREAAQDEIKCAGEPTVDRKMRKVSKELRKGERLIEKATKKNDRLADYDEKVRDPQIAAYKKMKKCNHKK
jgi:hypothetical protein